MELAALIDERTKLAAFEPLLYEALGGREVAVALWREHEGESIREIADSLDMSKSFLHTKIVRAKATLRRLNLLPHGWEKQSPVPSTNE